MRRPPVLGLVLVAALALIASGCNHSRPGGKVVSPTPTEVVGKAPQATLPGKSVFLTQGCGGCHTFGPAGTKGAVGPDLDKLAQYAQAANQASVKDFTSTGITDPSAYVEKGYSDGIMPTTYGTSLSQKDLQDLVAFLTQSS